jgi:hypothetical protein
MKATFGSSPKSYRIFGFASNSLEKHVCKDFVERADWRSSFGIRLTWNPKRLFDARQETALFDLLVFRQRLVDTL